MRKVFVLGGPWLLLLALFAGTAAGVDIVVAPHTINLASNGQCVTIHIDIPYVVVDRGSLDATVNGVGVAVASTKADDCGDLVVKLSLAEVKDVLENVDSGPVPVTVGGVTLDGVSFGGASTVNVVRTPKR